MSEPRKAVALISGGLDSMLAAKAVLEQGVHVEGINFYTGFASKATLTPFVSAIASDRSEIMRYGSPSS
ncbi:hypothetical protein [Alkalilimnicola ehrlichii]|uniref:hypothetical protein n=1 Tax=Alkalilimnicola ehrlichii TaxID=351052 RepID=UPI002161E3DE|nr:hypothetical protein [Alkalilimnicola ehrlichii]